LPSVTLSQLIYSDYTTYLRAIGIVITLSNDVARYTKFAELQCKVRSAALLTL
jgi:hypothetical protein